MQRDWSFDHMKNDLVGKECESFFLITKVIAVGREPCNTHTRTHTHTRLSLWPINRNRFSQTKHTHKESGTSSHTWGRSCCFCYFWPWMNPIIYELYYSNQILNDWGSQTDQRSFLGILPPHIIKYTHTGNLSMWPKRPRTNMTDYTTEHSISMQPFYFCDAKAAWYLLSCSINPTSEMMSADCAFFFSILLIIGCNPSEMCFKSPTFDRVLQEEWPKRKFNKNLSVFFLQ